MDLASSVVAVLALGVLVIVHEGGHYLAARWGGMSVSRFSVGFGPSIYSTEWDGTRFQIGAIPFGGFVQIDGMHPEDGTDIENASSFVNRPRHLRAAAILAGPAANYLLAWVMLVIFYAGFATEPRPPFEVLSVQPGSAAEEADLKKGDLVVGINGRPFDGYQDLSEAIAASGGQTMKFDVRREGAPLTIPVTPNANGSSWRVGIGFGPTESVSVQYSLGEAVRLAGSDLILVSTRLLDGLVSLVSAPSGVSVSGPVGMIKGLSSQVQRSAADAYRLVASISIMLGFFNLLPIPALDGGRLVFLAVGAVRRKDVEPRVEAAVHGVGFLGLLGLMVVVSLFDLAR